MGYSENIFIKNIFLKNIKTIPKKELNYIYMSTAGINDIEQFTNDIYYSLTIKKLSNKNDAYANI